MGRSTKELSRDLAYLLRLWKSIVKRIQNVPAPTDIYEESDMMIRTIRDTLNSDIDRVIIDDPDAYERAKEFLKLVMPRMSDKLELYKGSDPMFYHHKVEKEIAKIHAREVPLPDGGSIVIDQTEALVAIDVNSGNFRTSDSAEESAYRLNMSAAREIARQLRLRDLGGVIVNDFIDMRREKHRRGVERTLRDAVQRDRARTKILRTSPFGLVEMTRQRIKPGFKRSLYQECPCCGGRGNVKTAESMALEVIRMMLVASEQKNCHVVEIKVHSDVSSYLNNQKRRELSELEARGSMEIVINASDSVFPEFIAVECSDENGRKVHLPDRLGAG